MNKYVIVDGRNAIYRAVHAGRSEGKPRSKFPAIFMKFIGSYISKFNPSRCIVCWDSPSNIWRHEIYPDYKGTRTQDPEIKADVKATEMAVQKIMSFLPIIQLQVDKQEADDLIYAICKVVHPETSVVISNDGDMMQLPFYFGSVKVYDPIRDKLKGCPDHNPVIAKAMMGDTSDNIQGYKGIGAVRSRVCALSYEICNDNLDKRGKDLFERNLKLIDLSMCPFVVDNMVYVISKIGVDCERLDIAKFKQQIMGERIPGILSEMISIHHLLHLT